MGVVRSLEDGDVRVVLAEHVEADGEELQVVGAELPGAIHAFERLCGQPTRPAERSPRVPVRGRRRSPAEP